MVKITGEYQGGLHCIAEHEPSGNVLNTDAHGVETLNNMSYAVATARRAWLGPKDIANTRSWTDFKKLTKR